MTERLFHCSEGNAHKFWCITIEGRTQTIQFGRIGAAGQTQTKEFESESEASEAGERLIRQKLAKGYVEMAPEAARQVPAKKRATRRRFQQLCLAFDSAAADAAPAVLSLFAGNQ